jgi:hypothetical protein
LLAVTAMRSVEPASAETGAYVAAFAPAIGAQAPPDESQRSHWVAYELAAGDQVPIDAVSVWPTAAVPETTGRDVSAGPFCTLTVPSCTFVRAPEDERSATPRVLPPFGRPAVLRL